MTTAKTQDSEDPKLKKLVRVYLKMKTKRDEISDAFKAQEKELAEQMDKVARARELAHTSHLLNHHHESVEGCVWCTQLLKRVEGF